MPAEVFWPELGITKDKNNRYYLDPVVLEKIRLGRFSPMDKTDEDLTAYW